MKGIVIGLDGSVEVKELTEPPKMSPETKLLFDGYVMVDYIRKYPIYRKVVNGHCKYVTIIHDEIKPLTEYMLKGMYEEELLK